MTSRRSSLGVLALGLTAVTAAVAAGPAQLPPPTGPQVQFARLEPANPVVGQTVSLVVRVKDAALPIRGMRVDFAERGGRLGSSACRTDQGTPGNPFKPGPAITIRAGYRFRTAGLHAVAFSVWSGGCAGVGLRFDGTLSATVAPRSGERRTATVAQGALCSHADTPATQANARTVRAATMCLINAERRRRGRAFLRTSSKLARAAAGHTQDMVRRRFFEHEGPRGPSFARRLSRVRYKGRAGENIAYETGPDVTARSIVRGWMDSPPHKANILRRDFRGAGVGVAKQAPEDPPETGGTFTADFGSARR